MGAFELRRFDDTGALLVETFPTREAGEQALADLAAALGLEVDLHQGATYGPHGYSTAYTPGGDPFLQAWIVLKEA